MQPVNSVREGIALGHVDHIHRTAAVPVDSAGSIADRRSRQRENHLHLGTKIAYLLR